MSKPANGPDRSSTRIPDWARNASKMVAEKTCAVLKRSLWSGCATCATKILKAFFYDVPGLNGLINTGLKVVCACMTLFLLLEGTPKTFPDLMQVCLPPCGFNDAGIMEGDGGAVQWTDKTFQEVLHYVCVMTSGYEVSAGTVGVVESVSMEDGGLRAEVGNMQAAVGKTQSAVGSVKSAREGAQAQGEAGPAEAGSALVRYCGGALVMRDGKSAGAVGKPPSAIGNDGAEIVQPTSRCQVIREGEALRFDEKPYTFGGAKRWRNIIVLITANGAYVKCDKKLKGFFSKDKEANAFYEAAIEAEGQGRNGTGRYRMKT